MCCGGYLRGDPDDIFIGENAVNFFKNIKIDIAFFGLLGINPNDGWMVPTGFEATLVKSALSVSSNIIGLADHSKLNRTAFLSVGPINLFDEIILTLGPYDEKILEGYPDDVKLTIV